MDTTSRPGLVKQAVVLIVATFVVGALKVLLDYEFLTSQGPVSFVIITMISTIAIVAFVARKIWIGRNWARITFAILFLLGFYPAIQLLPAEIERSLIVTVFSVLQSLAQIVAIVFLFLPESGKWFREIKRSKNA